MPGLVPAIHAFTDGTKNVDAWDKPGHDGVYQCKFGRPAPYARSRSLLFAPSAVHGIAKPRQKTKAFS